MAPAYQLVALSKEFEVHCRRDAAKRCILFAKVVLRSLNVWPDDAGRRWQLLVVAVIVSEFIMGTAHLLYVLINVAQITKMTTACTTVLVSFETVAKLATMQWYRAALNQILAAVWRDFWPASLASARTQAAILLRSNYVTLVGVLFLCMAFFSNAQFMMFPLVRNVRELPLASWYPFDFRASPLYECMYVWQWFMNQVIITTLAGFDAFFYGLVVICSTQLQLLQQALASIGRPHAAARWSTICRAGRRSSPEMDMLVACVKHHLQLMDICARLEAIFAHIVFIQFVVSAAAICVSCVALLADPAVWQHMLSYLIAHLFQFFIYCSVGDELTYQSGLVAEAAYACNWQESPNCDFRRALVLVLQRAQRPVALTVAGLMRLSYASFVSTVHLSFSFYVLLTSFV